MDLGLKNKVAVITGGTAGIGKALAMTYLAEGAKVVVCGRSPERLDACLREFDSLGYSDIIAVEADIAAQRDQEKLLSSTLKRFGRMDIWVNNAGTVARSPLLEASMDEWDAVMNTNLKAVFSCTKLAGTHMKEHGGGVIVNASSFASRIPLAGTGIYAASKWGVNALTQVAAAELAPFGIRVFAFIPGLIATEITKDRVEANKESLLAQIPLNRLGGPEDLASIVVMLTSEKASYFTGVTVEISGGKCCVQNPRYGWEQAGDA
jgi:NAD(P)-dependent dehydrogenase (short-subunit alcohol dehydrogenase family)